MTTAFFLNEINNTVNFSTKISNFKKKQRTYHYHTELIAYKLE